MEWKVRTDDDKEFVATDTATFRKWITEKRITPRHYVFHPVLQRWLYAREVEEVWPADSEVLKLENRVVVKDLDMPFGSMVTFMVKWAIAAIPALIILSLIGTALFGILAGLGASLRH
jgi:hypothetical protein